MKLIFALFIFLVAALPALAGSAGGPVPDTVFGKEEKRIITDYLNKKLGLPETAKSASSGSDEDEPRATGKKKKNKKAKKNKGKGKKKGMPPGLAKRKQLPPGLARRHTLPPGLAVRQLPTELESQLPEPEAGLERIMADDNVVLIEKATGRILDIILGGKP